MRMKRVEGYWWPDWVDQHYTWSIKRVKSLQKVMKCWKKTRNVIQAGGSYGVWPKILAANYDLVYTFEPEHHSFLCLCRNCPEENIIKVQGCLADKNKCVCFGRKSFTGHHIIEGRGTMLAFKIDDLNLPVCDAILLDVEGYEHKVLKGAKRVLDMYRPLVLYEDRAELLAQEGEKPGAARMLLEEKGYKLVDDIGHDKIFVHSEEMGQWQDK